MIPPSPFRVYHSKTSYENARLLLTHTLINKEYVIDSERRIDLVIQNADFFIPMEPLTKSMVLELETDEKYIPMKIPSMTVFMIVTALISGLELRGKTGKISMRRKPADVVPDRDRAEFICRWASVFF